MLNIEGVQGLEYRALLLSTVRTCTVEPGDSDEGSFLSSPKVSASYMCLCIQGVVLGTKFLCHSLNTYVAAHLCGTCKPWFVHMYIVCVCVCVCVCVPVH